MSNIAIIHTDQILIVDVRRRQDGKNPFWGVFRVVKASWNASFVRRLLSEVSAASG
jgi:hypothetical protein